MYTALSENAKKRRTVFPPVEVELFDDGGPTASSPPQEYPITEKLSSAITAPRKKVQNQKHPIELNLRFERQKPDKSAGRPVIHDDPWKSYQGLVYLNGSCNAIGAYSLHEPETPKMVMKISPALDLDWLKTILGINHEHIVPVHEAFIHQDDSFLVYEMMCVSLKQVLTSNMPLNESQVAKICQEVLDAIHHLSLIGLCHGNINSSTILFSVNPYPKGRAKLAYIHNASRTGLGESHDVWSLGRLMLEMMEKESTIFPKFSRGDTLSFSEPNCWSPEAKDFLRNTSTVSAKDLVAHGFLRKSYVPESSLGVHLWHAALTVGPDWEPVI